MYLLGATQKNSQFVLTQNCQDDAIRALLNPNPAAADILPVAQGLMQKGCCGREAKQLCVFPVLNLISCDRAREKKYSELLQISAKHFEVLKEAPGYRAAC